MAVSQPLLTWWSWCRLLATPQASHGSHHSCHCRRPACSGAEDSWLGHRDSWLDLHRGRPGCNSHRGRRSCHFLHPALSPAAAAVSALAGAAALHLLPGCLGSRPGCFLCLCLGGPDCHLLLCGRLGSLPLQLLFLCQQPRLCSHHRRHRLPQVLQARQQLDGRKRLGLLMRRGPGEHAWRRQPGRRHDSCRCGRPHGCCCCPRHCLLHQIHALSCRRTVPHPHCHMANRDPGSHRDGWLQAARLLVHDTATSRATQQGSSTRSAAGGGSGSVCRRSQCQTWDGTEHCHSRPRRLAHTQTCTAPPAHLTACAPPPHTPPPAHLTACGMTACGVCRWMRGGMMSSTGRTSCTMVGWRGRRRPTKPCWGWCGMGATGVGVGEGDQASTPPASLALYSMPRSNAGQQNPATRQNPEP